MSYNLYKFTENFNDTTPSFRIDKLQECYIEALLGKTELTMKEKKAVMKTLNLKKTTFLRQSLLMLTNLFVTTKA